MAVKDNKQKVFLTISSSLSLSDFDRLGSLVDDIDIPSSVVAAFERLIVVLRGSGCQQYRVFLWLP